MEEGKGLVLPSLGSTRMEVLGASPSSSSPSSCGLGGGGGAIGKSGSKNFYEVATKQWWYLEAQSTAFG